MQEIDWTANPPFTMAALVAKWDEWDRRYWPWWIRLLGRLTGKGPRYWAKMDYDECMEGLVAERRRSYPVTGAYWLE